MRMIAADDEPLALELLCDAVRKAAPDADVTPFAKPSELLAFAQAHPPDVAFLDIRMRGMSGVALAKKLKECAPAVNIVFVTGYSEYAGEAMAMHASGYILKPVTAEKVRAELADLRRPIAPRRDALLRAQCFGNFDVFTRDGAKLHFERSKAKEILAYLVYRSGTSCTVREIATALFEDTPYDRKQQCYMQKIISSMMRTLRSVGAEAVVLKKHNSIAVNLSAVDCDYYRFLDLDADAVNAYCGEFMSQYAWAEFVVGYLDTVSARRGASSPERSHR